MTTSIGRGMKSIELVLKRFGFVASRGYSDDPGRWIP